MTGENKSFWTSLPGISTGIAAVITAITGLYLTIYQNGGSTLKDQPDVPVSTYDLPSYTPIQQLTAPNGTSLDTNGDGLTDAQYWRYDTNSDGLLDYEIWDTNLNGKIDQYIYLQPDAPGGRIVGFDQNEDRVIDFWGWDTNNDRRTDVWGWDKSRNQIFDTWGWDQNRDGVIDLWGYDTDEDGVIEKYQPENR